MHNTLAVRGFVSVFSRTVLDRTTERNKSELLIFLDMSLKCSAVYCLQTNLKMGFSLKEKN